MALYIYDIYIYIKIRFHGFAPVRVFFNNKRVIMTYTIDDKKQLLNHLERLITEQDKAIAKGDKYINKNWRLITKGKIELLKQSIKGVK